MNVLQRLQEIRKRIAYIRKEAKVESYRAVTHDQVTAETRDLFVEHGVLVLPILVSSQTVDTGTTTKSGTPIVRHEAVYDVRFFNVDDPARVDAHGNDQGDKGPGKTLSYAVKNVILKALQIETGEQDESRVEGRRAANDPPSEEDREQLEKLIADQRARMDECTTRTELKEVAMKAIAAAVQAEETEAESSLRAHYKALRDKLPVEKAAA
jgi:hypothetical protein